MYKNIIIISSDYTGHGHKSITEALTEQLAKYEQIKVHVIDGYSLSGTLGLRIGKLYGTITRASKDLWKMIWDISMKKPSPLIDIIESSIRERFLKLLKNINPDAIIVTHPNYNTSVLNILEQNKMEIPLFCVVADPVSISPLWADARACYTICPTTEAKDRCMEFGVPESRIKVFPFLVRERFTRHIGTTETPDDYDPSKPLRCMIMSGGEGSGNMSRIAKILLENYNCRIKIVCGRNKLLKKRLERTLIEKYQDRIEIFGFVNAIQDLMLDSDIMFTRGSPNVMMEAIMCNVPLVITGALPGQEEGNPGYAEKYGLGIVCTITKELKKKVNDLLANNAAMLNRIKKSQREYRDPDSAKKIVEFIVNN